MAAIKRGMKLRGKPEPLMFSMGNGLNTRLALILLCLEDQVSGGKNPPDFITSIKWLC